MFRFLRRKPKIYGPLPESGPSGEEEKPVEESTELREDETDLALCQRRFREEMARYHDLADSEDKSLCWSRLLLYLQGVKDNDPAEVELLLDEFHDSDGLVCLLRARLKKPATEVYLEVYLGSGRAILPNGRRYEDRKMAVSVLLRAHGAKALVENPSQLFYDLLRLHQSLDVEVFKTFISQFDDHPLYPALRGFCEKTRVETFAIGEGDEVDLADCRWGKSLKEIWWPVWKKFGATENMFDEKKEERINLRDVFGFFDPASAPASAPADEKSYFGGLRFN